MSTGLKQWPSGVCGMGDREGSEAISLTQNLLHLCLGALIPLSLTLSLLGLAGPANELS